MRPADDERASVDSFRPVAARAARLRAPFTREERIRLAGLYGFIAILHVLGWGLYLRYSTSYPTLVGLGFVAYMLGLRHAFDADHIAAIDDTVRYMLQQGRRPLGIGFFFSLGHATVVLGLSVGVMFAATLLSDGVPAFKEFGALISASISGAFLWIVGMLNLLILLGVLGAWRKVRAGTHDHRHLEELLAKRGLATRLFRGRLQRFLNQSWQMYPLGLLFGLGFDTASEVALLAITAGAAAGNLPVTAVLSLPILFAAGMSLMDTTDGIAMVAAYRWAFVNPLRRTSYNIATTSLTIVVALVIGTVELLQVLIGLLGLHGPFFDLVAVLDLGVLGYVIVGLFIATWATLANRLRRRPARARGG